MTRRAKQFHVMLILAFVCTGSSAAREERYVFNSLVGQPITIFHHADTQKYSIEEGDVTTVVEACDPRAYRVCFDVRTLAIAVPRDPPKIGSHWTVNGTRYSAEVTVEDGKWLGRRIGTAYVINAEQDLGSQTVHHRLLFSYLEGLLAFDEAGGVPLTVFIASDLPSLGHGTIAH